MAMQVLHELSMYMIFKFSNMETTPYPAIQVLILVSRAGEVLLILRVIVTL